ncbi:uncharacterized protein J8A68_001221 [[Candida] subhashii]|uniref:[PSI+] induction protein 2 n=1 Tax=[Candida] subhashii TaxID=561895 RepID=A0A8J5V002_9ASCO|nr:uncharacterized protein J8A68_001221 [[Candida] subhashii]KAG7665165.1 hypothetical protein J8A68_001221 [[Candida] subhashii]
MYLYNEYKRDIFESAKSTAEAFKSWDTCMANRTCKIVAIVLIVVGSLFVIWILTTLFQCIFMGAKCLDALCCCCCRKANRLQREPAQTTYVNPNMYPPTTQPRYAYQPQPPPSPPSPSPQFTYQAEKPLSPPSPSPYAYQPQQPQSPPSLYNSAPQQAHFVNDGPGYTTANRGYEPVYSSDPYSKSYNDDTPFGDSNANSYRGYR